MAIDIARRINSGEKLPVFSLASRKALFMLAREEVRVPELAEVISSDQVLASSVLRLVNAAANALSRNITSVAEAIAYIGLERTRSVIYVAEAQALFGNTQSFESWNHALSAAYAAELIASRVGGNTHDAFIVGLIHDIGKIFLERYYSAEYDTVLDQVSQGRDVKEAEMNSFGFNHAEVGALLLKKWKFPSHIVDAVSRHCDCSNMSTAELLLQILIVANWISYKIGPADEQHSCLCDNPPDVPLVRLSDREITQIGDLTAQKVKDFLSKISAVY